MKPNKDPNDSRTAKDPENPSWMDDTASIDSPSNQPDSVASASAESKTNANEVNPELDASELNESSAMDADSNVESHAATPPGATPTTPDVPPATEPAAPMHLRSRTPALIVLVLLLMVSSVVHGYLDGRWSPKADLQKLGSKLEELPNKVGTWELVATSQLDPAAERLLQCYGSSVREYLNLETGTRVNVAVLFGPRGPIACTLPKSATAAKGQKRR